MRLGALLRPSVLVLVPACLSAAVWLAPLGGSIRRGFTQRADLTFSGVCFLIAWYGLIAIAGEAGFALGQYQAPLAVYDRVAEGSYYRYFSAIGLTGVGYTYGSVAVTHPGLLAAAFRHAQLNVVRTVVPYSAGVQTLRYATAVAGALGLYQLLIKRNVRLLHLLNVTGLLLAAAIASRLLVVLCMAVFIGCVLRERGNVRIGLKATLLALGLFFLVLTPLNYYRNASYYRAVYHVTNPFVMNVYEMSAYLGAPFQAAAGVASASAERTPSFSQSARAVEAYAIPTYVPFNRSGIDDAATSYRAYVDVDPALTTNSVLAALFSAMGWWCLPFIVAVAFFAGAVMGHASRYRSVATLVQVVVGYAFLETWRVYLFNAGIIQFIVIAFALAPVFCRRHQEAVAGHDRVPVRLSPT